MNKVLEAIKWVRTSFEENGKNSSKRNTLFAVTVMLGYVVYRFTDTNNAVEMALVLTGLICSLVGITVYGGVKSIMKGDNKTDTTT